MLHESLLGEHWTRASNIVVRKKSARETTDSPTYDVAPAEFQLKVPERHSSRRISSLLDKSEQDIQQLRRASAHLSPKAPVVRKVSKDRTKESKNPKIMQKDGSRRFSAFMII